MRAFSSTTASGAISRRARSPRRARCARRRRSARRSRRSPSRAARPLPRRRRPTAASPRPRRPTPTVQPSPSTVYGPTTASGATRQSRPDEDRRAHAEARNRLAARAVEPGRQPERHRAVEDVAVGVEIRLGLAEVDPVVVGRVRVELPSPAAISSGNVSRSIETGRPAGITVEDLALEQIGAGVDFVRSGLLRAAASRRTPDAAGRVVDDAAERLTDRRRGSGAACRCRPSRGGTSSIARRSRIVSTSPLRTKNGPVM